jgi:GMP synthase-like glutamine amidotransferase
MTVAQLPLRISALKHVPFEGPAGIADWARRAGHVMTTVALYSGEAPPSPDLYDWLVVMGGPMSVGDEADHPWLPQEKAAISAAIAAGKTVVGVCLGAQLIAEALGARVYPNGQKEIGWMPIELTVEGTRSAVLGFLPRKLEVFHWHGDTFDLPPGAVHLARSEHCVNQAFLYEDRVLGLQFHLESTPQSVADIVRACAAEIVPSETVQCAERILAATAEEYAHLNSALVGVLERLAL